MLFKRVGQPAPHRKVCALEFDVTRSEVFQWVLTACDNLGEKRDANERRNATRTKREANEARRTKRENVTRGELG